MIIHGRVFCDACSEYIGQLWSEPCASADLLENCQSHVCVFCQPQYDQQFQHLGSRPQLNPVRY